MFKKTQQKPNSIDVEAMAVAFLEDAAIAEKAKYLRRGRQYQSLDTEDASRRWIDAFKSWLSDRNHEAARLKSDLSAELRLRDLKPPYKAVMKDIKKELARDLTRDADDPELTRRIEGFLSSVRKSRK